MAKNVNVLIENWRATGQTVQTPQYAVDLRIEWVDSAGVAHEHEETVRFPNVLAQVPAAWVKEEMEDLLLRALRKKLGVDEVEVD